MLGMHGAAFANYAVDDCDFLIAVGARFDDRVAGVPDEVRPERQAHRAPRRRPRRGQQGEARAVEPRRPASPRRCRRSLRTAARGKFRRDFAAWTAELAELKRVYAMNYDRASPLIQPYYVIEEINRHTRGEAIITTGVGQHQMWAAQYCDFADAAPVAHLRQHGHHGLRPAGGDRRADRAARSAW